jgi:lipase
MPSLHRRSVDHLSVLDSEVSSDARPLVFLHGVFDSAACWTGLMGLLSPDVRMIAIDARAHGKSTLPDDDFTMATLGADTVRVIEQLGSPVTLIGHSMGGVMAQQVAVTRPDLVGALVLEDPGWAAAESLDERGVPTMVSTRAEQLSTWTAERILEQGHADHPLWSADEFESWFEAKQDVDLSFVRARHDWLASTGVERMTDVAAPTLLLTAEVDRGAIVAPEKAARTRELMGDRLTVAHIENAGHDIRKDQRQGVAAVLGAWLAEH